MLALGLSVQFSLFYKSIKIQTAFDLSTFAKIGLSRSLRTVAETHMPIINPESIPILTKSNTN